MSEAATNTAAPHTSDSNSATSSSSSSSVHPSPLTAQLRSKPIAPHASALHTQHNGSSSKRVTFDPTPPSSLSDGLLSNSFESSAIPLTTMSDQRLTDKQSKKPAYSSLAAEDDDDGPPPLESAAAADDHSNCSGHGHSHGSSSHSPPTRHNNRGRSHSHSSSSPGTPKRSPVDNCGGMKGRKSAKTLKAEESNRKARRQLMWASACCCIMMIAEIVGGLLANSLAIMTDAAHLLSDLAGFLISIFALWLATRPATSRLSFGFHRAEILGALISVLLIWVLTGILVYEACWRLAHPEDVDGKIMFIVATCGLVVNFTMGMILLQGGHGHSHGLGGGGDHGHSHSHGGGSKKKKKHNSSHHALNDDADDDHGHSHAGGGDRGHAHGSGGGCGGDEYKGLTDASHVHSSHDAHDHHGEIDHPEEENLNVKAAFIHVLGDALQSVGVMIAAALIWWKPEWRIADPLCTFLFSILVLFTTTRLIRQSVAVLMEGVPEGIEPDDVEEALLSVPGVIAVHDLHIWSLSVGKPSLSVHLYVRDDAAHVLAAANKMCAAKFNIHHSTIQVERQHDDIECNDAFLPPFGTPGHASLDRIASENFASLGITQV